MLIEDLERAFEEFSFGICFFISCEHLEKGKSILLLILIFLNNFHFISDGY